MHTKALLDIKEILVLDPPDESDVKQILEWLGVNHPNATKQVPRLVRRKDAAKMLARSERAIDLLAQQGHLKRFRLPGRDRGAGFLESDILALLS